MSPFTALRRTLAAAGVAAALVTPSAARAQIVPGCGYLLNYTVSFADPTVGGIRNGFAMNAYQDGGGGMTWPMGAHLDASGFGVATDVFAKDFCTNRPLQGFLVGILGDPWSGDLDWPASEPSSQFHVVMLMNHAAAQGVIGREFLDVFGTSEDELLDNLFLGTTIECREDNPDQRGCAGIDYVADFGDRVRNGPNALALTLPEGDCALDESGNLVCGPQYGTMNGWFQIPSPGQILEGYDIVSFSSGTAAGVGAVTLTATAAAVPEPGTWALLLTGLAGVGAVARRRRRG